VEYFEYDKLAYLQEKVGKGQKRQYHKRLLTVPSWVLGVFLLFEAGVPKALILQPKSTKNYLKTYLNVPSYSPRLLLSGKESMAIYFSWA
jgi:hypothetical protein